MTTLVERLAPHLAVLPILLPMGTAAVMLLMGEGRRPAKVALGASAMLAGLAVSIALLWRVSVRGPVLYVPGGWPAAYGIAVVADGLAAFMLVLAWALGACALIFASARWHRAGVHFHPLLQLQLMGLSGAFLAGDLFNLFVFFEILLAASYGLLLHGSGRSRIVAGLRYVAVNLTASSLFLVGATMLYGVTGTLNMAALSEQVAHVAAGDRGLVHAGAAILAVAFLAKAAAWPLNLWLVPAYSAATAPAAAVFAILTKVGVYALLRMWTLLFSGGPSVAFGSDALLLFGAVTASLAALAMIGASRLAQQAALSVIVSAGTLLAALGLGRDAVTGGALFYLTSSALSASALFLLVDVVERWQNAGATLDDKAPYLSPALEERDVNLDDEQEPLVGYPFPASTAFLGLAFMACMLLVAGLPPLSSFVGKFAMLSAAVGAGDGAAPITGRAWVFLGVLVGTGFASLFALTRTGIRIFWSPAREGPRIRLAEGVSIVVLLAACIGLTVAAGPVSRYALDTARALHSPGGYVDAVLGGRIAPATRADVR
ncbi:MAG TPA: monovalent cation/H+ antiporter subunit D [Anaeromyxobacteraceae bacterium]|nr:monovalent cation/H+ antiporter subunit D [Anaeromyxobacteraceae bacterium]